MRPDGVFADDRCLGPSSVCRARKGPSAASCLKSASLSGEIMGLSRATFSQAKLAFSEGRLFKRGGPSHSACAWEVWQFCNYDALLSIALVRCGT